MKMKKSQKKGNYLDEIQEFKEHSQILLKSNYNRIYRNFFEEIQNKEDFISNWNSSMKTLKQKKIPMPEDYFYKYLEIIDASSDKILAIYDDDYIFLKDGTDIANSIAYDLIGIGKGRRGIDEHLKILEKIDKILYIVKNEDGFYYARYYSDYSRHGKGLGKNREGSIQRIIWDNIFGRVTKRDIGEERRGKLIKSLKIENPGSKHIYRMKFSPDELKEVIYSRYKQLVNDTKWLHQKYTTPETVKKIRKIVEDCPYSIFSLRNISSNNFLISYASWRDILKNARKRLKKPFIMCTLDDIQYAIHKSLLESTTILKYDGKPIIVSTHNFHVIPYVEDGNTLCKTYINTAWYENCKGNWMNCTTKLIFQSKHKARKALVNLGILNDYNNDQINASIMASGDFKKNPDILTTKNGEKEKIVEIIEIKLFNKRNPKTIETIREIMRTCGWSINDGTNVHHQSSLNAWYIKAEDLSEMGIDLKLKKLYNICIIAHWRDVNKLDGFSEITEGVTTLKQPDGFGNEFVKTLLTQKEIFEFIDDVYECSNGYKIQHGMKEYYKESEVFQKLLREITIIANKSTGLYDFYKQTLDLLHDRL